MEWKTLLIGFACCMQITLADDICNGVISEEFIEDPESCDHFYYCEDGKNPVLTLCPKGMLFNPKIRICDLPQNVTCGSSMTTETKLPSTTMKPIVTTSSTSNYVTMVDPLISTGHPGTTANEEVKCPIGNSKTVQFVRSKTSCREYFICYQGTPFKKECLPELQWNDSTKKCDLPEIVKCELESLGYSSCPSQGQDVYAHPTKCDQFIYCLHGFEILQQCPFYYHFDIVHKKCLLKTQARCILDN